MRKEISTAILILFSSLSTFSFAEGTQKYLVSGLSLGTTCRAIGTADYDENESKCLQKTVSLESAHKLLNSVPPSPAFESLLNNIIAERTEAIDKFLSLPLTKQHEIMSECYKLESLLAKGRMNKNKAEIRQARSMDRKRGHIVSFCADALSSKQLSDEQVRLFLEANQQYFEWIEKAYLSGRYKSNISHRRFMHRFM